MGHRTLNHSNSFCPIFLYKHYQNPNPTFKSHIPTFFKQYHYRWNKIKRGKKQSGRERRRNLTHGQDQRITRRPDRVISRWRRKRRRRTRDTPGRSQVGGLLTDRGWVACLRIAGGLPTCRSRVAGGRQIAADRGENGAAAAASTRTRLGLGLRLGEDWEKNGRKNSKCCLYMFNGEGF